MTHLRLYSIFLLSALSSFFICQSAVAQQFAQTQNPSAQELSPRHSPDFKMEWKTVDSLSRLEGKVRSAIALVWQIQNRARKEGNEPQVIKSLLYILQLTKDTEENADSAGIRLLEKETGTASAPARAILQSLTAEAYWNYFQWHRNLLYGSTSLIGPFSPDINTWTVADFHQRISALYIASIGNEHLLQKTSLEPYDPILIKGNTRSLRPTLFDLLANRALAYFSNNERDLTRPSYAFVLDDTLAFAPLQIFINHFFYSKDTASLQWKALLIYQRLLTFHQKDSSPGALIDADLGRLAFALQYSTSDHKGLLYKAAMQELVDAFPHQAAAAQATYLLAERWHLEGMSYEPLGDDTSHRYDLNRAVELCSGLIREFPLSEGGIHAQELLTSLLTPVIQLQTEAVNLPEKPFRAMVRFKNADRLYLRIIPFTENADSDRRENELKYWSRLSAQRPVREGVQALPTTGDYQFHAAEIKIDGLPVGEYMLEGSKDADFRTNKNPLVALRVYVSSISYIQSNTPGAGNDYFILNRETGQPLGGAGVQVWSQEYNYTTRATSLVKKEHYDADGNGHFHMPDPVGTYRNIRLDIHFRNDHLFLEDAQNVYIASSEQPVESDSLIFERNHAIFYLFTDRGIYRPGQIVYFKGIGVTEDFRLPARKNKLFITPDSILVYLRDPNGQTVDSLKCLSNDFGSIKGILHLPLHTLTGRFNLVIPAFSQSDGFLSVEEYKRPRFEVLLNPIKGVYRLEDTIVVNGSAKGYAGNSLGGASVAYSIIREARFPFTRFWRTSVSRYSPTQQIGEGSVTTAADGSFSIQFKAIPDLSQTKEADPVFGYLVNVNVTDINGETHSTESRVEVGYKALNLSTGFSDDAIQNLDSLHSISIHATNLAGAEQVASVAVRISKLAPPGRLIRTRYWERPDLFTLDEAAFIQLFPHDEYHVETDFRTWPIQTEMVRDTFITEQDKTFPVAKIHFTGGVYRIELDAKDTFGVPVQQVTFFQVYDPSSMEMPYPAYEWASAEIASVQPGKAAVFQLGSSFGKDLFIIRQGIRPGQMKSPIDYRSLIPAQGRLQPFTLPVSEDDRGGFVVSQAYVAENRFYQTNFQVNVPWDNKDLYVRYKTFREKTSPGSPEIWTATVTGKKGERVSAEIMAGMYDASLDPFSPNIWSKPPLYGNLATDKMVSWTDAGNFHEKRALNFYENKDSIKVFSKNYDEVLRIGDYAHGKMMPDSKIFIRGTTAAGIMKPANREKAVDMNLLEMKYAAPGGVSSSIQLLSPLTIPTRKDFNETAFFFPELRIDSAGEISFSFVMPDALTRWNLQTLAHTKDLSFGLDRRTIISEKTLMLQPNVSRFIREGDRVLLSTKITSLDTVSLSGLVRLYLLDAVTMEPIDQAFGNTQPEQSFTVTPGQSVAVTFPVRIPDHFDDPITYRLVASAGNFSDGEEASIPVLPRQLLITESLPLSLQGDTAGEFHFDRLLQKPGESVKGNPVPYRLTLEYCSNPVWYAVQAIPYLMESSFECSEQIFNRYYANTLAAHILQKEPHVKEILEAWGNDSSKPGELVSNLQKDQELKSVLLQETPWVMQADNETAQKRRLSVLMNINTVSDQQRASLNKLTGLQTPNGGFAWFGAGLDDPYITQYIIAGLGHLQRLHALSPATMQALQPLIKKGVAYLDTRITESFRADRKRKDQLLGPSDVQYLYARSFFTDIPLSDTTRKAWNFYAGLARKQWLGQRKYMQGMIALALYRSQDRSTARKILASLEETSINHPETGRYWKSNTAGWNWYESPVEAQALLIEAFAEMGESNRLVNSLRVWLLAQKQTQAWPTTKATADACYALLLQGSDWLETAASVEIRLGDTLVNSQAEKTSQGTGYFKKQWSDGQIHPEMGRIRVTPIKATPAPAGAPSLSGDRPFAGPPPSWGALYYQYFQDIRAVTAVQTELSVKKEIYVVSHSAQGEEMRLVEEGQPVHIGDRIRIRLLLRSNRDLDYVHLKDLPAACLEPVSTISGNHWQGGLVYYQSTLDASTHFFFSRLAQGTHVLEYDLNVSQAGTFSGGIATVECQYAPQFSSHSEGTTLTSEP